MPFALSERYRHKIKTPEELRQLLGAPPRKKKVIMCHGVFDVVHPGHVRHLIFAKSKADVLVASLTSDAHINKGMYRPHVPQDLRAFNIAAFEMVDARGCPRHRKRSWASEFRWIEARKS